MFNKKRKKFLEKLKAYGAEWDDDYAFVWIMDDGRMIPTNNFDLDKGMLNKRGLFRLVSVIQRNT